jgi:hypothetical protein
MSGLYVALIHHPVYDRNRTVVTTALTNIDVHDIARSCCTFGVRAFYVITPVDAHRALARRVVRHWQHGHGADYNPTRREALEIVRLERSLDGAEIDIERETGVLPRLIATSARELPGALDARELRAVIEAGAEVPYLVLLGTGWGLTETVLARAHHNLAPIRGPGAYNHLSVRAAAAVILDRLAGKR